MALIRDRNRWELLESMLGVADGYDTSQNSFIHQALACAAIELDLANKDLMIVSEKFDVTKLFGEELDEGVFQRTGITRKPARRAEGEVVISGKSGIKVPQGTSVFADKLEFVTLDEVYLKDGQAKVAVRAVEDGYAYNVPVGSINKINLDGVVITDITNLKEFYSGRDRESDWELKERCLVRMREPAKAGNLYHFEEWVGDLPGVYACKAFRRWKNQQTVRVVVAMDDGRPADQEEIERLYEELEEKQLVPFGAELILDPVETRDLNFSLNLSLKKGYDIESVEKNIIENLKGYLTGKLFDVDKIETEPDSKKELTTLSYAEMGTIIFRTGGVLDYEDLRINDGTNNISVPADTLGVVSSFNVGEVK